MQQERNKARWTREGTARRFAPVALSLDRKETALTRGNTQLFHLLQLFRLATRGRVVRLLRLYREAVAWYVVVPLLVVVLVARGVA